MYVYSHGYTHAHTLTCTTADVYVSTLVVDCFQCGPKHVYIVSEAGSNRKFCTFFFQKSLDGAYFYLFFFKVEWHLAVWIPTTLSFSPLL